MHSEILEYNDSKWLKYLEQNEHEFYQVPLYLKLEQEIGGGEIKAFYFKKNNSEALVPFIMKKLPLKYKVDYLFDAKSPYGYSGILFSSNFDKNLIELFFDELLLLSRKSKILTHFIRLNPIYNQQEFPLSRMIDQQFHGPTVYVDLQLSESALEQQISNNHRRNISKLVGLGFTTEINNWSQYDDFQSLYLKTMKRLNAKSYYHFNKEYFEKFKSILAEKLYLACTKDSEGKVVSSAIFSNYNGIVQYHLGATDENYLKIAPSKLLFSDVIKYFKYKEARLLHLGGGLGTSEDSLFRFKKGFGNGIFEFCSLNLITDRSSYLEYSAFVEKNTESVMEDDFFPTYRSFTS